MVKLLRVMLVMSCCLEFHVRCGGAWFARDVQIGRCAFSTVCTHIHAICATLMFDWFTLASKPVSMPRLCCCGARRQADGTCATEGCAKYRLSGRGANFLSMAKPRVRVRVKQQVPRAFKSLPQHHSRSKAQARIVQDGPPPADAFAAASAAIDQELKTPGSETVAHVRNAMRAKTLEILLVDIFGEPTYFRIMAVALSWLERCPCMSTLQVKVCAAALLLTGINFEGAAPLRPCIPIAHLADHFQVSRKAIVQCMATLCSNYQAS
jgi:hypothetical protein